MQKIALIALAASAAIATPALAQSVASGTVAVNGTVAGKCTAITPISETITLNELALANGTVDGTFSGAASGGLTKTFTVKCTTATPRITVSSNALTNTVDPTTANGYTGTVNYTSTLVADQAPTGFATAIYITAGNPPASTTALTAPLKNATGNVRLTVSAGTTTNGSDVLKSGTYTSTVTITVSPA